MVETLHSDHSLICARESTVLPNSRAGQGRPSLFIRNLEDLTWDVCPAVMAIAGGNLIQ